MRAAASATTGRRATLPLQFAAARGRRFTSSVLGMSSIVFGMEIPASMAKSLPRATASAGSDGSPSLARLLAERYENAGESHEKKKIAEIRSRGRALDRCYLIAAPPTLVPRRPQRLPPAAAGASFHIETRPARIYSDPYDMRCPHPPFLVRRAGAALEGKDAAAAAERAAAKPAVGGGGTASNEAPKAADRNPFLPPDPALVVADSLSSWLDDASEAHRFLLNKFNVAERHGLVTTTDFASQEGPLDGADWAAVLAVLREGYPEGGVAFFNCGPESGASQPHRHVQTVPLSAVATGEGGGDGGELLERVRKPEDPPPPAPGTSDDEPPPDALWPAGSSWGGSTATPPPLLGAVLAALAARGGGAADGPLVAADVRSLPYIAVCAAVPDPDGPRLASVCAALVARAATSCGPSLCRPASTDARGNPLPPAPRSYNVVALRLPPASSSSPEPPVVLVAVPRSRATAEGVEGVPPLGVNGLSYCGTLLVRTPDELAGARDAGGLAVLTRAGIEWDRATMSM